MRSRRIKLSGQASAYHCMSRTVNGEHLFGPGEKEVLRRLILRVADFCGVEVVTYCVMSNHFHVLLRVPETTAVPDAELLRRYAVLYPRPSRFQPAPVEVVRATLAEGGEAAERLRAQLLARMGDVSEFMKTLKQRFSVWFNRNHDRFGTLWAERFRSVLVEDSSFVLRNVAAYIDLNPVRAGLVQDPKDYRFCGYANAVAGVADARRGLACFLGARRSLADYRKFLFGAGSTPDSRGGAVIDRKRAVEVIREEGGVLSPSAVLRCRLRHFTYGAVLGCESFVDGFAETLREYRYRKRRPTCRRIPGADWDLRALNGLHGDAVS